MASKGKKFKLPHVYLLLILIMIFVVILSWIVPSGEFAQVQDPNSGRMLIDPNNYSVVPKTAPITLMSFFTAIHDGIVQSAAIIVLLLMASGAIYVLEKSGSINAGIHRILEVSKGKEIFVVVILMLVFTIMGVIGFAEGGLPFLPLAVSVVVALGYDKIAGVATAMMGMAIGFASGVLNLYTTGISQTIVGLPIYSGIGFRTIALILFYIITTLYVTNYCRKIKADPSKSLVADKYTENKDQDNTEEKMEFTISRKLALVGLLIVFVLQAVGAIKLGWGISQISALYIMFAVVLTILLRINPNEACITFAQGAARLLPAALTIGLARSIMVLMTQAKIVDTAIYNLAQTFSDKGTITILFLIFISVIAFNFFVISGSGKAVILMPILGPLGQLTKINQQVMVLIYNYGDGFTNFLWPTSGLLMAGLTMCDVEWEDWAKFATKLILLLSVVGFGLVVLANYINLGPF